MIRWRPKIAWSARPGVKSRCRLRMRKSSPLFVTSIDLVDPLSDFPQDAYARHDGAWVLVRVQGQPLGIITIMFGPADPTDALATALVDQFGSHVSSELKADSRRLFAAVRAGVALAKRDELADARTDAVRLDGPAISVVLCTLGDRPTRLASALDALAAQDYPRFEIIIVDNGSRNGVVAGIANSLPPHVKATYAIEPRTGLSRARKRGVKALKGDVVAFIDDDELADPNWLTEMARGYLDEPDIACVTGLILPAKLDTPAQGWFEQFGGHNKGRGFTSVVFDPAAPDAQSPFYPLPPFGAGGNMSFRRGVLARFRGFDTALGAGTRAHGAEETLLFSELLDAGLKIAYRPAAMVWHHHYAELAEVVAQMRALGTALTAYYTALVVRKPRRFPRLLRLLPQGVRDMSSKGSVMNAAMRDDYPAVLVRAHRKGMAVGPFAYLLTTLEHRLRGPGAGW